MATVVGTYYGTAVGATTVRFRAVAQLQYTSVDTAKGYYFQRRYYIEVTVGQSSAFTNHATTTWSSSEYSLSKVGIYADTGWKDVGWIAYGKSVSANGSAQYTSSSSGVKKSTASGSYKVPALSGYTVTYNANGGSGAPSSQTKKKGTNLTLSSTKPTRTGYDFYRWNTQSNGQGTNYQPGATYSTDANLTLYAIWSPKTIIVTYDSSGASVQRYTEVFRYGMSDQKFGSTSSVWSGRWTLDSGKLLGWDRNAMSKTPIWSISNNVVNDWINANSPAVRIYAIWNTSSKIYIKRNGEYVDAVLYAKKSSYKGSIIYAKKDGVYMASSGVGKSTKYPILRTGVRVAFVGDSITAGTQTKYAYHMYVGNDFNWTCYNYGYGGSRFTTNTTGSHTIGEGTTGLGHAGQFTNNKIIDLLKSVTKTVDLIVISGGTNDYGGNIKINEFTSAVKAAFEYAKTKGVPVIVIAPPPRSKETANGAGATLGNYRTVLIDQAKAYGFGSLNLAGCMTVDNKHYSSDITQYNDGLHPNACGHRIMADKLEAYIRSYLSINVM